MNSSSPAPETFLIENAALKLRLEEVEGTLAAITSGAVDALLIGGRVFTLEGAERPYHDLVDHMAEGAAFLNQDGVILYANRYLADLLDTPLPSLIDSRWLDQVVAAEQPSVVEWMAQSTIAESHLEISLITPMGEPRPVLLAKATLSLAGQPGCAVIVTDLRARKAAEAKIERLNRLYVMASAVNATIARQPDRTILFQEFCRIAVDLGSYRLAWIGVPDPTCGALAIVAAAGATGYLEGLDVSSRDVPAVRGPIGLALREGRCTVVNDFQQAEQTRHWHDQARAFDLRASASVPFHEQGAVSGVFNLYGAETGCFSDEDLALLRQMGDDLTFALEQAAQAERLREAERQVLIAAERERAAAALQQAAHRYQTMLATTTDAFWIVDAVTGRLLEVNDAAARMTGYTREELLTLRIADLEAVETPDQIQAHIMQSGLGRFEGCYRAQDGRLINVEVSTMPDAETGTLMAFLHDFTERLQTENALRQLSLAVEQIDESIVITDREARIEYVNPAFLRATGFQREEVLGQNPKVLQSGKTPRATYDALWAALSQGQSWQGEFINRRKDGRDYIEWASISPLRQPDGCITHYVAVKQDITERKRIDAELARANRAKSEFLANMSHEIRTPMNAILGLTQILERDTLAPDQQDLLHKISEAGSALLRIINDILDFSKIEAGQFQIDAAPFTLAAVLTHMQDLLTVTARHKGLTLSIQGSDLIEAPLVGDAMRIEQVLANLIGNAIKFTTHGRVEVRVTPLDGTEQTVRLRFTVTDTGVGITPEQREKLFQPFSQGDASTTRRFGGTGLGLSISKRLVELMGGTIGVTSTPGQGSTFWFELPLPRAAETTPRLQPPPPITVQGPRLTGLRVLAVDDNRINLFMLQRALHLEGATVMLAADGQQALDTLRASPAAFDVVLMDIQMPVMDGLTATRTLREDPRFAELPVIALTAGVLAEERAAAQTAGMSDFLAKPLDLGQMVAVLLPYVPT